ncbi:hypothetical protein [Dyadobacter pollutisoli]|uniref:Uncharacterized protein n=1 Tax=Dyadobacter pollutisoli TaxID=2910158 RepID=A0A9E8SM42_9BACT|nr:hypothetical protein [Dyadobacter pollutisoli]WAC13758.1 hypothetical protein ON006_07315 [Dyadobacter pollutisoli]
MITYTYYGLLSVFCIFLFISVFTYLWKPAPSGDSSVGWALGIFYLAGLVGIIVLALLFWQNKTVGLIILCVPLVFLSLPFLRSKITDLYAWFPVAGNTTPLTVHIVNTTDALIRVKIECWFGRANRHTSFLYKTMVFTSKPLESTPHQLSEYQTVLLSRKSKYVSISIYECILGNGPEFSYMREIQPCMQFWDQSVGAFRKSEYVITIDAAKNSDAFRSEVKRLKKDNMYTSGAF